MKAKLFTVVLACGSLLLMAAGHVRAELIYATTGSNIAQFDSNNPALITTVGVFGLQPGETLVGIDIRPSNGLLYGLGTTSRLYTINPLSGLAMQVGTPDFSILGSSFGLDFNPVPDLIRLVSDSEQNLRIRPNDGTLAGNDTPLNPPGNIVAAAYTNNFAGATMTTLYGIDSVAGTLVLIGGVNGSPSPNGGTVTTINSFGLGTNFDSRVGFDVSGLSGTAFASITTSPGQTRLYQINLATAAATDLGLIGSGVNPYLGLTAATAIPEPGSVMLLGGAAAVFGLYRRFRRARS